MIGWGIARMSLLRDLHCTLSAGYPLDQLSDSAGALSLLPQQAPDDSGQLCELLNRTVVNRAWFGLASRKASSFFLLIASLALHPIDRRMQTLSNNSREPPLLAFVPEEAVLILDFEVVAIQPHS